MCRKASPILFSDDTNLFYRGKDLTVLVEEINNELSQISLWLKSNKLSLNIKKTHFMVFHRKKLMVTLKSKLMTSKSTECIKLNFLALSLIIKLHGKNT